MTFGQMMCINCTFAGTQNRKRMMDCCSRLVAVLIFGSVLLLTACSSHDERKKEPTDAVELHALLNPDSIYINLDDPKLASLAQQIDSVFVKLQKLTGFNGTVLYAERGRLIYEKAFGFADVRRRRDSLTVESQFQLASVSKMFTAMAIMILHHDKLLYYDDDVRKYIPEWPYEGITIRQLLNHRSGISRYETLAHEKWIDKTIPMLNDDMIRLYVEHQPAPYFKPDKGFHYGNVNYALLASVVERVSHQHFEDFMHDRIFKPLSMSHSFIHSMRNDSIVSDYVAVGVPGHDFRGRRVIKVRNDYLNGVLGDKMMYATAHDLYLFNLALDYGILVPKDELSEAFSPGSPRHRRRPDNYGFGWRIKGESDSAVYHYGWWKGFRTFFIRDMAQQKTLIVLTNKDKGPGSDHFWNIINNERTSLYPASVNLKLEEETAAW